MIQSREATDWLHRWTNANHAGPQTPERQSCSTEAPLKGHLEQTPALELQCRVRSTGWQLELLCCGCGLWLATTASAASGASYAALFRLRGRQSAASVSTRRQYPLSRCACSARPMRPCSSTCKQASPSTSNLLLHAKLKNQTSPTLRYCT